MINRCISIKKLWILYGIPILFLSIYPVSVEYFGEFSSLLVSTISNSDVINVNTMGIFYDLLIGYSIYLLIAPLCPRRHDHIYQQIISVLDNYFFSKEHEINWHHIRVYIIKLYFLPMMMLFLLQSVWYLPNLITSMLESTDNYHFVFFGFIFIYYLGITIDLIYFTIGYLIESQRISNTIQSTDPFLSGWVVCLICYPPFVAIIINLTNGGVARLTEDYFIHSPLTSLYIVGATLLFLIPYTLSSINLGFKASNLTYRGVVNHGMYSLVRHPAYISKIAMWSILTIPLIILNSPLYLFALLLWIMIYILRALTEERHIMFADSVSYAKYRKQVPFRFIPGVW